MKIKRNNRFHAEVATASMNDIMFFLLLFFLIVSTLGNPNVIKLVLPKSDASESQQMQPITVTITSEKKYYIGMQEIPQDKLEEEVKRLVDLGITQGSKPEDMSIVLRLAPSLTVQDLADLMKIGVKLNVRMVLATQKEGGGK